MHTTPPLVYPPSLAATADLARSDCARLERLSAEQRAELDAGLAYIRAVNLADGRQRGKIQPLPEDFLVKLSTYAEALMTRKSGIPARSKVS
jgi:hypothetical protein